MDYIQTVEYRYVYFTVIGQDFSAVFRGTFELLRRLTSFLIHGPKFWADLICNHLVSFSLKCEKNNSQSQVPRGQGDTF